MKIAAALMLILAIAIGIVPQFTNCEAHGRVLTLDNGRQIPMKCHWTARAEVAVALPLGLVGLITPFSKRKESSRILSILGILLGAAVILLPTALIGVCANPEMICNAFMRPFLILTGSIVIGISGITLAATFIQKEVAASKEAVI